MDWAAVVSENQKEGQIYELGILILFVNIYICSWFPLQRPQSGPMPKTGSLKDENRHISPSNTIHHDTSLLQAVLFASFIMSIFKIFLRHYSQMLEHKQSCIAKFQRKKNPKPAHFHHSAVTVVHTLLHIHLCLSTTFHTKLRSYCICCSATCFFFPQ